MFCGALIVGLLAATPAESVVASADATARQEAAVFLGGLRDAHSLSLLWQLSFDPEPDVRQAACDAAVKRCEQERPFICAALLGFFANDPITEIGWTARNRLLTLDVEAALVGASAAYKLEVLSRLGGEHHLPLGSVARALRLLSADPDPGVQENAAWLLERTP